MKKWHIVSGLTFALSLPTIASAEQPSYSYLEAGYSRLNLDDIDIDPDGYYVKGSFELSESFFVRAMYWDLEDDFDTFLGNVDVDVTQTQVGIGYKRPAGDNTSFYVAADYLEAEVDIEQFGDADADGYQISAGLRSNLTSSFELYSEIGYADVDDTDGFIGLLGGVFHIANGFGISLEGSIDDDSNSMISTGIRYSF